MEQKHTCEHCGGRIAYPGEAAGRQVNCPHCMAETILGSNPAQSQNAPSPLPQIRPNTPSQGATKASGLHSKSLLITIGVGVIVVIGAIAALVSGLRSSASRKSSDAPHPSRIQAPQIQELPVNGSLFFVTAEQQNVQLGNVNISVFDETAWKQATNSINQLVLSSDESAVKLKPMFSSAQNMAQTLVESKNASMSAAYSVFLHTKNDTVKAVFLNYLGSHYLSEEIHKPFRVESKLLHKCWSMLIDINRDGFDKPGTLTLQKPLLHDFAMIASNMTTLHNEQFLFLLGTNLQAECKSFFNNRAVQGEVSSRDYLFLTSWTKGPLVEAYQQCIRQHAKATNNLQEWNEIHKVSQALSDSARSFRNLDEILSGYCNSLPNAQDGVWKATTDAAGKFVLRLPTGKTYHAVAMKDYEIMGKSVKLLWIQVFTLTATDTGILILSNDGLVQWPNGLPKHGVRVPILL